MHAPRRVLLDAYAAALAAVDAQRCTAAALVDLAAGPLWAIVAGKAAEGMLRAVLEARQLELRAAVVAATVAAPADLARDPRIVWQRAGHPLPDAGSLAAGAAVARLVDGAPRDARVFVLLSGGASALLERPRDGVALADLIARDSALLASGAPISVLNRERATLSTLKGGGLATLLGARPTTVFYISDVTGLEGDGDAAVVGSGPCHDGRPSMPHRRVADNAQARAAAMAWAAHRRLPAIDHGLIAGDATVVGVQIAASLRDAPAGLHLWGGECTVVLPANPGRGGRCQQLALAAAPAIAGRELALLAVGSDGRDGPGTAAGALVDGGSAAGIVEAGFAIEDALARCDAGRALAAAGDLIDTAATGTNVADLVFGWAGRA